MPDVITPADLANHGLALKEPNFRRLLLSLILKALECRASEKRVDSKITVCNDQKGITESDSFDVIIENHKSLKKAWEFRTSGIVDSMEMILSELDANTIYGDNCQRLKVLVPEIFDYTDKDSIWTDLHAVFRYIPRKNNHDALEAILVEVSDLLDEEEKTTLTFPQIQL